MDLAGFAIMNKVLVSVFLVLIPALLVTGAEYNYRANDTIYGPKGWNSKYPTSCGTGKRQSPIDIVHKSTTYKNLGSLKFGSFDEIPSRPVLQIGNNKHSYRVYLNNNNYSVEGAGLPGKFRIFSFHFHWGADDTKGSEHTLDGKMYPAAMHVVNFNLKYKDINEAVSKEDGLAALGVLLEVGAENQGLASFLKFTSNLTHPEELKNMTQTQKISDLFPTNRDDFYRYNGSLTTPECQESVTWTVFKNTMKISAAQLKALRGLKDGNSTYGQPLVDTFRPVQPLNGRTVYRTFDAPPATTAPTTGTGSHSTSTAFFLVVLALIAMFN